MSSIRQRDSAVIWHPYTQMKLWPEAIAIARGEGAELIDEEENRYIDAISSWWVNLHGHAHPFIAAAVSRQLSTLEHCIFANFTHEPAVALAERLLPLLPGDMARAFFSDNGSTAVEVALKMAIQYHHNRGDQRRRILALEGAYHGDTFGAMSVSERSLFTDPFRPWLFEVSMLPFPAAGREQDCLDALEQELRSGSVAALIVEPLVQGASGMNMYAPSVLSQFAALCHRYGALLIADEVMTGFGRTGTLFACGQAAAKPDIVCLSKGLTGGTMPLGLTTCTAAVYDAFYSDDLHKTLYHGHSFTANPLACAAANASLDLLLTPECEQQRAAIMAQHQVFAISLQGHPALREIRQTGTILALEFEAGTTHYHNNLRNFIYQFSLDRGVLLRPLGNVVYLLPPYCITDQQLGRVYACIRELSDAIHSLCNNN